MDNECYPRVPSVRAFAPKSIVQVLERLEGDANCLEHLDVPGHVLAARAVVRGERRNDEVAKPPPHFIFGAVDLLSREVGLLHQEVDHLIDLDVGAYLATSLSLDQYVADGVHG